jgi:aspartate aminotransferase
MQALARKREEDGHDVISLATGEPDMPSPPFVGEGALQAIQDGHTHYTPVAGIPALCKAVLNKLEQDLGYDLQDASCLVAAGAKQIIFNAFLATLDPGNEVVIPAPYWVSYPSIVTLLGGKSVVPSTDKDSPFKLTPQQLRRALTLRTKWLILNAPANPTGIVYNEEELKALGEVLRDFPDVWILSDDIYKDLSSKPVPHLGQVASFLRPRLLIVDGVSKSFAMTGWRVGFGVGPEPLIKAMEKIQSQQTSNTCSIAQHAALKALENQSNWLPHIRKVFDERRDFFLQGLRNLGFSFPEPQGAFYVYVCCDTLLGRMAPSGKILCNDTDVAEALLETYGVATVPGVSFGLSPFLRLSYAKETRILEKALSRLEKMMRDLQDVPNLERHVESLPKKHASLR